MKMPMCVMLASRATSAASECVWSQALESPGISRRLTDDGRVLPESKLPPLPALPAGFVDLMTTTADPQFAPTYP